MRDETFSEAIGEGINSSVSTTIQDDMHESKRLGSLCPDKSNRVENTQIPF